MPAVSKSQARAAGADVARCRAGKKPKTFGDCKTAEEYARVGHGGMAKLPERKRRKR